MAYDDRYIATLRAEAKLAADEYARMDPEDKARRFVAQDLIVPPELVRVLLDRLDRRDGCHGREVAIRVAAQAMLDALDLTTRPRQPAIDDEADRLRAALADNVHPARWSTRPAAGG